ncbi:transposase [Saccharopolyspora elongata]|uniref:Transposase n=1 Tax=Saccharopolyspora elongata TaxID=2530387 RepID=A0A4R4YUM4_9PSEU|nr:transposase [Saccharopolyspora elongata]TDD49006.1 hypothetical protein E1288_21035 [Saccharopolyspora elongata]
MPKRHGADVRIRTVQAILESEGRAVKQAARKLGISCETVASWVWQERASEQGTELERLRRENVELASAYAVLRSVVLETMRSSARR